MYEVILQRSPEGPLDPKLVHQARWHSVGVKEALVKKCSPGIHNRFLIHDENAVRKSTGEDNYPGRICWRKPTSHGNIPGFSCKTFRLAKNRIFISALQTLGDFLGCSWKSYWILETSPSLILGRQNLGLWLTVQSSWKFWRHCRIDFAEDAKCLYSLVYHLLTWTGYFSSIIVPRISVFLMDLPGHIESMVFKRYCDRFLVLYSSGNSCLIRGYRYD